MSIILATGGTKGHISPAITLAKALKIHGHNSILFTNKKINKNTNFIKSYILPLCKPSNKLKFFLFLIYSCVSVLYRMKKIKPKLVIGFGGYSSFPTLLAAKILFIPIILHEQNIILGRVNRLFSKNAKLIATSFPETKFVSKSKFIFTGNFINIKKRNYPRNKKIINILIIAGSQGANFFDEIISSIICSLPIEIKKKLKLHNNV